MGPMQIRVPKLSAESRSGKCIIQFTFDVVDEVTSPVDSVDVSDS